MFRKGCTHAETGFVYIIEVILPLHQTHILAGVEICSECFCSLIVHLFLLFYRCFSMWVPPHPNPAPPSQTNTLCVCQCDTKLILLIQKLQLLNQLDDCISLRQKTGASLSVFFYPMLAVFPLTFCFAPKMQRIIKLAW